jgi:hypothetical protein
MQVIIDWTIKGNIKTMNSVRKLYLKGLAKLAQLEPKLELHHVDLTFLLNCI